MPARRVIWAIAAVAVAMAAGLYALAPYARSAAFVADLSGVDTWWRQLLPVRPRPVSTRDLVIPTRHGSIGSRLYEPDAAPLGSLVVYPGIHAGGVDEPRLVSFARRLAGSGIRVVTVPLPDLRVYRVTADSTDAIEDTALWVANDPQLAPGGRVGLVGVSFAGGLALVAAGRPALQNRLALVVSLGGHGDLPRVMTYLCTGRLPDGTPHAPHDYGVVVVLLASLARLVPADQVGPVERAILTFLDASSYAEIDPARAAQLLADARRQHDALPEPSHTLMTQVLARDARAVGQRILPFVEDLGGAPALSPVRSAATTAPVFLLHGRDDNVIPSTEASFVATYLQSRGNAHVRSLLTPLISHANLSQDLRPSDAWQLVRFWTEMIDTVERR
jgi:pimeloyl-ACP methyl ester carboxylesterase